MKKYYFLLTLTVTFLIPYLPLPVWKFLLFTPITILLMIFLFKPKFFIAQNFLSIFRIILTFILFFYLAYLNIHFINQSNEVSKRSLNSLYMLIVIISPFFQALQEEFYLRSGQVWLTDKFKFKNPFFIPLILAFIISSLHFMIYRYGMEGHSLSFFTLLTLFLFFYLSSLYFQIRKNFLVPLAMHSGWNVCRFGFFEIGQKPYMESKSFNLLEGQPITLTSVILVSFFLTIWLISTKDINKKTSYFYWKF